MKRLRYVVLVGVVLVGVALLWLPAGGTTGHRAGAQTAGWTWTGQPATGPPARGGASMAYDAARGVTVLFGGFGSDCEHAVYGLCGDTWTWDGTQWSQQQVSGPPARLRASMVYDAARDVTVLFGGVGCGDRCGDTWTLVGAPAAVASAAASSGLVSPPGVPSGVQATPAGPDSIRLNLAGRGWQTGQR
jgi:hypothetical protein